MVRRGVDVYLAENFRTTRRLHEDREVPPCDGKSKEISSDSGRLDRYSWRSPAGRSEGSEEMGSKLNFA